MIPNQSIVTKRGPVHQIYVVHWAQRQKSLLLSSSTPPSRCDPSPPAFCLQPSGFTWQTVLPASAFLEIKRWTQWVSTSAVIPTSNWDFFPWPHSCLRCHLKCVIRGISSRRESAIVNVTAWLFGLSKYRLIWKYRSQAHDWSETSRLRVGTHL
jgi:hypothetical protein